MGLTPGSNAAATLTGGGSGLPAAQPPRPAAPAKTPGSSATGGSLARLMGKTPLTGGGGAGVCVCALDVKYSRTAVCRTQQVVPTAEEES